jgi:hypothetical protein
VSKDLSYITDTEFENAFGITEEIGRMINGFVKKVKDSGNVSLKKK